MIRNTRLAVVLAFAAGMTVASAALAQTQAGSAAASAPAPEPASTQTTPPPEQPAPAWLKPETPATKPWTPDNSQPTYSVDPPPEGASGIYLPAAVLGYAKSAAGCVVVGCDNGPQVGGAAGPAATAPAPAPAEPPPAATAPTTTDSH